MPRQRPLRSSAGRHLRDLRDLGFAVGGRSSPSWVARKSPIGRPAIIGDHRRKSTVSKGREQDQRARRRTAEKGKVTIYTIYKRNPHVVPTKIVSISGAVMGNLRPLCPGRLRAHSPARTPCIGHPALEAFVERTHPIGFESGHRRLSSRGAAQRDLELTSTKAWSKLMISATPRRRQLARRQRSLAPNPGCRS